MKFSITMTWSKMMAFLILVCAVIIDVKQGLNGVVFMFSLPFVSGMVVGKQYIDRNKKEV